MNAKTLRLDEAFTAMSLAYYDHFSATDMNSSGRFLDLAEKLYEELQSSVGALRARRIEDFAYALAHHSWGIGESRDDFTRGLRSVVDAGRIP